MANKQSDVLEPRYDGGLIRNKYVKAGLFITKTRTQRNTEIKTLYRELDGSTTTLCYVSADNAIYELIANPSTAGTTDQDWKKLDFGVSDILVAKGTWDADNTTPVLQDSGAVNNGNDFYVVTGAATPIQVQYVGLFGGEQVTVKDGDWIISNGTEWFVSAAPVNWDSISGIPQTITDYVAGTVIVHPHEISDVNGLQAAIDLKFDISDVGDHNIAWSTVPDAKLVDAFLLKANYFDKTESYSSTEVDAIVGALNPLTTKGDLMGHNGTTFTRVPVGADGLALIADAAEASGWKWGALPETGWKVQDTTTLTGAATIDQNNSPLTFKTGELSGSGFSIFGTLDTDIDVNLFRFNHPASTASAAGFTEVFIGAANGNGAGAAFGNIGIGQNNMTGLLPAGEWQGGRNVAIGFGIAPQFATPAANMSTHNVLLGRKLLDASGGDISYIVGLGYEVGANVTSLQAGVFQQMILMGIWAFEGVTLDAAVDDIVSSHDAIFLGTSAFRGGTGMYNHGNSGSNRGGIVSTVGVGTSVFRDATIERYNIGLGDSAGRRSIMGRGNITIGVLAGADMTGGTAGTTGTGTTAYNIFMGTHAGQFFADGVKNTFVGSEAGQGDITNHVTGDFNAGFSAWTLNRLTGHYNTGLGAYAGYNATATLVGNLNTFVGSGASYHSSTPILDEVIVIASNHEQVAVSNKIYIGSPTQNVILNAVDNDDGQANILVHDDVTGEIKWRSAASMPSGTAVAAGATNDIQYNTGDALDADGVLTWQSAGNTLNTATNFSDVTAGSMLASFVTGDDIQLIGTGTGTLQWTAIMGDVFVFDNGDTFRSFANGFVTGTGQTVRIANGSFGVFSSNMWGSGNLIEPANAGIYVYSMVGGVNNISRNSYQMLSGANADALGIGSWIHGLGDATKKLTVDGDWGVLLSSNTAGQTVGHGILSDYSAIIGGVDGNIPDDSHYSVILGGQGLKMPAATENTVLVDNFLYNGEFSNVSATFYYDNAKDMLVAGSSAGLQPDFGAGAHADAGSWSIIAGEEHDFTGTGSGGGRPVNLGIFGWHHSIGDTSVDGAFSGSAAFGAGTDHEIYGRESVALGFGGAAHGWNSFVMGHHDNNAGGLVLRERVLAGARGSINMSTNEAGQTAGHGALGISSGIFAGRNSHIPADSPRSVVLGGDGLKMPATTPDMVLVPALMLNPITGDYANPSNGQIWYNNSTNKFRIRENGVTGDMAGGGGWAVTGTTTLTGNTFIKTGGNTLTLQTPDVDFATYFISSGVHFETSNMWLISDASGDGFQTGTDQAIRWSGNFDFRNGARLGFDTSSLTVDNALTKVLVADGTANGRVYYRDAATLGGGDWTSTSQEGVSGSATDVIYDISKTTSNVAGSFTGFTIRHNIENDNGDLEIAQETAFQWRSGGAVDGAESGQITYRVASNGIIRQYFIAATTTGGSVNPRLTSYDDAAVVSSFGFSASNLDVSLGAGKTFAAQNDYTAAYTAFSFVAKGWVEGLLTSKPDRIGLNLTTGDVATPVEGQIWYNNTTNKFRAFENAAAVDIIGGGGWSTSSDTTLTGTAGQTVTLDNTNGAYLNLATVSSVALYGLVQGSTVDNVYTYFGSTIDSVFTEWAYMYSDWNNTSGLGMPTKHPLFATYNSGVITNSVNAVFSLMTESNSTSTDGIGVSFPFYIRNGAGNLIKSFEIESVMNTVANNAEEHTVTFSTWKDGNANKLIEYKTTAPALALANGSASGADSFAVGQSSNAIGADSISIGFAGIQAATGGIGIGRYSQTTAQGSIMLGYHTAAQINSVTDSIRLAWDGSTVLTAGLTLPMEYTYDGAGTGDQVDTFKVQRRTSGVPAANFGQKFVMLADNASNTLAEQYRIESRWWAATAGSEESRVYHYVNNNGTMQLMTFMSVIGANYSTVIYGGTTGAANSLQVNQLGTTFNIAAGSSIVETVATDALTNNIRLLQRTTRNSTGTVAAGYGISNQFRIERTSGYADSYLKVSATNVGASTYETEWQFTGGKAGVSDSVFATLDSIGIHVTGGMTLSGETTQVVHTAHVQLSASQTNGLGTTPIEIVAAPAAGFYIQIIAASVQLTHVTTAHSPAGGGTGRIDLEVGAGNTFKQAGSLIDNGANLTKHFDEASAGADIAVATALNVTADDDYTGGGTSTIDVYVQYVIVDAN